MFTNWRSKTGTSAPSGSRVRSRSRAMRPELLEDRLALSSIAPGQLVNPAQTSTLGPIKPGGEDPFRIGFDENGRAFYQIFDPATGKYGPTVRAQSFVDQKGVLNYILPEEVGPGDVAIVHPFSDATEAAGSVSDLLRFTHNSPSPGGPIFQVMEYFSDPGESDKADTGFPTDANLSFHGANELGPEGLNFFEYPAGNGDPRFTNFYDGISDFGA